PRHCHGSDIAAVRRADGRSRPQGWRRNPRPAAGPEPRIRKDDRHGHARSARRGSRQAHAAPRKRLAARNGGRMKFLPLVWRSLWRRKVRTTFTLLSIFIAFLLFGVLMTIRSTFSMGVDLAGLDRLMVIH